MMSTRTTLLGDWDTKAATATAGSAPSKGPMNGMKAVAPGDQLLKEATNGVGILHQEEGDQEHEESLLEPVENGKHVLDHRLEVAGQQGGQVGGEGAVALAEVDGDPEDRERMVTAGQVLEVGRHGGSLFYQGDEFLPGEWCYEGDARGEQHQPGGIDADDRRHSGHPVAFDQVDERVQDQGQHRGDQEGAQNPADGERKDSGNDGQHSKKEEGTGVLTFPEWVDPFPLNHAGRPPIWTSMPP